MASTVLNLSPFSAAAAAAVSGHTNTRIAAPHTLGLGRYGFRVNALATVKVEPAKVVPQADRVLIRLVALPEKSAGGVLLPKSAVKFESYLLGEILSVGSDVSEVESGSKVLFSDVNAYEVDLGTDARHCFCKESDLLAVIE